MRKGKKRFSLGGLLVIFLILSLLFNPTKQDYIEYTNFNEIPAESFNEPVDIEIERKNFFIFSTYAPKLKVFESYCIVHLGFMNSFFQISDGQYDYPWWLKLFN
ncbi:hypothetical protein [Fredinandcohnia sp. FSL W7-1320]|uniref:hypothetical protein n=1 Tax=Fredinandcohnia sp. FSL W7-1320 TaxID=2954540 RepID=UPI0030FDE86A